MINQGLSQGSAKIYQFPAGGRAALGGRRYGETRTALEVEAPVDDAEGRARRTGDEQDAIAPRGRQAPLRREGDLPLQHVVVAHQ